MLQRLFYYKLSVLYRKFIIAYYLNKYFKNNLQRMDFALYTINRFISV